MIGVTLTELVPLPIPATYDPPLTEMTEIPVARQVALSVSEILRIL